MTQPEAQESATPSTSASKPRWPRFVRVMTSPRSVFLETLDAGQGFGNILILLGLEYLLTRPGIAMGHIFRMSADPIGGLAGLWSAMVSSSLKTGVLLFATGALLHLASRRTPRRVDTWTAASALAYAWSPHFFIAALGVVIGSLGYDSWIFAHHSYREVSGLGLGAKFAFEYGPTVWLMVVGWRTIWPELHSAAPTDDEDAAVPVAPQRASQGAMGLTSGVGALLVAVTLAAAAAGVVQVRDHWSDLRPVLPGDTAPQFHLANLSGGAISQDALLNKVTVIDFWATWCPPCVASMPAVEALHQKFESQGMQLLSVNTEPNNGAGVRAFVKEHGLSFPVYVDTGIMQQRYGIQTLPSMLIIDQAGKVRHMHIGTTSMTKISDEVEQLLGGVP